MYPWEFTFIGDERCTWRHYVQKNLRSMLTKDVHGETLVAGIARWLERRTGDCKVPGSSPRRRGQRHFFCGVSFLCRLLFRYPFHRRCPVIRRVLSVGQALKQERKTQRGLMTARWSVALRTQSMSSHTTGLFLVKSWSRNGKPSGQRPGAMAFQRAVQE